MTAGRLWAIAIVVIIHIFLGYAFITGLAYDVVKKVSKDLKTFDVQEEPPPPEELPPPPPPDKPLPPPPVTMPPPIVQTPTVNLQPAFVPQPPPLSPPPPPAPPPPPPARVVEAVKAQPRGSPQDWATTDDYPPGAARAEAQGTTGFSVVVGPDGRVQSCSVTVSSGNSELDTTTCRLITRRARFSPAKDTSGQAIGGSFSSRIRWQLPKN
ncbi:Protein TonB [Sphingomonas antarctica]